jgi:hypothetical protein
MFVSTWKNGSGSFGVKISMVDRGKYFSKDWSSVNLTLEDSGKLVSVNIDKHSFWTPTCGELINFEIKAWLKKNGLDTWPYKKPHRLELKHLSGNNFLLCKPRQAR